MTISFNTNTKNEPEWLTPPDIIASLGEFDLDPCAPAISRRPWPTAKNHYSLEDDGDGLALPWLGRVWLNPPYGRETFKWLSRLAEHKSGIALVFARTETNGFHSEIWQKARAVFFFQGRLYFRKSVTGEKTDCCNAPSCLVSYSDKDTDAIYSAQRAGNIAGHLAILRQSVSIIL